ncbi:YcaO-like family protein [Candidatus Enterococcus lemimoniae]|uniref:YcaO domain-containing protein n=1 Tax=Candidatus Enterococcus lemimoniae TaxID=1834167 RepID=A0ABZ2T6F8_9ENTE
MDDFLIIFNSVAMYKKKKSFYYFEDVGTKLDSNDEGYLANFPLFNSKKENECVSILNHDVDMDIFIIRDLSNFESFYENRKLDKVTILEFFDCYLLLNKGTNICLKCFIQRYIEGIEDEISSFCPELFNAKFCFTTNLTKKNVKKIYSHIQSNTIVLYEKGKNSSYITFIQCYPNCVTQNFVKRQLEKPMELYQNTGFRKYSVKNFDDYIGRCSPVKEIQNLIGIDPISYPVFGAVSACQRNETNYRYHGGKGLTEQQAKMSAVGEAIERYCARQFGYENILFKNVKELNRAEAKYLNPNVLFPFEELEYKDEKSYEWVEGVDLRTKKEILIPANVVFFPYNADTELHFTSQSTTGLASGITVEDAILQGVCEVFERHNYSISHKTSDIKGEIIDLNIDYASFFKDISWAQNMVKDFKLHLTLLNAEHGLYTVHCVLESRKNQFPKCSHGSGASFNLDTAIYRAICESLQMRTSQIILNKEDKLSDSEYLVYKEWGDGNEKYFYTFLNNNERNIMEITNENKETRTLVQQQSTLEAFINSSDFNFYVVDLSRDDVPLKVVRIIVPEAQDIDNTNRKISPLLKKNGFNNYLPMFS